jgi:hypothetical protein
MCNKWGDLVIHRELWDFFGYMVLVVITAIAIFIVILPQALPH